MDFWTLGERWPLVQPVIHVTSEAQALEEASRCREAGSDGVFLIGHGMAAEDLASIHLTVRDEVGGFVGVNYLDRDAGRVLCDRPLDAVWADHPGRAHEHLDRDDPTRPLFYAGFAFKYQRQPEDLAAEAAAFTALCDVLTTSGTGTGSAPDVAKLTTIRAAIGDHPMAVASGVTPENAPTILPWVDAVLVATGISASFDRIDPVRLRALLAVRDDLRRPGRSA
jgi:predicted TIM-barrel enzyme